MATHLTGLPGSLALVVLAPLLMAVGCGGGNGGTTGTGGNAGRTGGDGGNGGNGGGTGGGSAVLCVPGASVSCACSNGTTGAQSCNVNGSGYGACSCTSSGAGGDAGAAGGGAGSAGRGSGGSTTGNGGSAGAGTAGSGSGGSAGSTGGGGAAGAAGAGGAAGTAVTPFTGSFTCTDFDTSGACAPFDTGQEGSFVASTSGSTAIAYPLDHALFPSNLGAIQVQLTTPGTAARIAFRTLQSNNVSALYYGSCESAPGSGCSVTIPLAFTQRLLPASQIEDIQLTARVLAGNGTPTADSAPISVAWASAGLTGGLYYWTVLPNQTSCPSATMATPGSYCLPDTTVVPKNGTAIFRYDFSQTAPAPQQVWTDDGGPDSVPSYQGAPQAWTGGAVGGHCIGCHAISNDGKLMGLTIGGSSSSSGANWAVLDIQNQDLLLINPTKTGGNGCNDPGASPTYDPSCYWQQYRKDAFATETTWGPNDDVMVSMYKSKLYFDIVSPSGTSATIAQTGLALPASAAAIDPDQSDPFWSHDGSLLVYTSFNTPGLADATGNPGGLNGDLKTGGQIAIADASAESIIDDARVLVPRQSGVTSYYPCVSEDSKWVVFSQSNCGGNPNAVDINYNGTAGYGTGVCDGYDDSSARLYLVDTGGATVISLDAASGGSANYDDSWPRFGPTVGSFRGQTLYWVVFSSRRPYGVQNNRAGLATSQPQLWFSAITVGEINVGDPSWAPVWLPAQNPTGNGNAYGNHTPQWVTVARPLDTP